MPTTPKGKSANKNVENNADTAVDKSTKKRTEKSYHHGDLKSSLIEAANTILVRDGADALSLRAIAAEVGVSHMAPYAHFKNKKELMQAVATAGFVQMSATMEQAKAKYTKPEELILEYGAAYLAFAIENVQLYRLMLGQVETHGRKSPADAMSSSGSMSAKGAMPTASLFDAEKPTSTDKPGATAKPKVASSELSYLSKTPFILLKEAFAMRTKDKNLARVQAIGAWSIVHGMSGLIIEGHIHIPEGTDLKQFLSAAALQSKLL